MNKAWLSESTSTDPTQVLQPLPQVVDVNRPLPSFLPIDAATEATVALPAVVDPAEALVATQVMPAVPEPLPAPAREPKRSGRRWLWVTLALLMAMAVLTMGVLWLTTHMFDRASAAPHVAVAPAEVPAVVRPQPRPASPDLTMTPIQVVWSGGVRQVEPTEASSTCSTTSGDDLFSGPGLAIDGNTLTTFSCEGDARGVELTVTLPENTRVAEVGVYASALGSRRLTKVTWTLPDGHQIEQQLDPQSTQLQRIRPRMASGTTLTLRIEESESDLFDSIAVPEIYVATPQ